MTPVASARRPAPPKLRPSRQELPQGARAARRERRRGRLRLLAWAAVMVGSLALVVSRQTAGLERERELGTLRQALSVAEAERLVALSRVQELQTRARITRAAAGRLGMHVAHDDEVVLLPLPKLVGKP